jgi:large subunit ribosomal protein L12
MSEYIHAALVLHAAKKEITEEGLEKIMKAAGVEPDTQRIKMLVSALSEVNIDQALSAQLVAASATAAPGQLSKPGEKPKEEVKAEEKEEVAGLGALFE